MGVFGRFFGRKEQVSTEEVAAEDLTAASEETEAGTAAAEAPAAEAVEIPKQQSAEVAADSETGEGART
ncbi:MULTISPECIES: hypothetical protein [unclassified Streptomyces]|uniref:hypothetical protein n=1 Tax=unclassified Streptomyces TaxID=2593676 RepID=UPI002254C901|nr:MULTISPECIES: hypothetical protein [unclassified Streptomyces]MCX4528505.1 hypothetical protein [Streptomyces sp. NBC_01551]MCX4540897.1 hypothetical protein [Streptomyces sp. NBC_01565]